MTTTEQYKAALIEQLKTQNIVLPDTWLNQNRVQPEEFLTIEGSPVLLADIYRKIQFEK